jgi:exonuclease VII large subunit
MADDDVTARRVLVVEERLDKIERRLEAAAPTLALDAIATLSSLTATRFERLEAKIEAKIEAKLIEHDARFDRVDARLAEHDGRFDRVDARLDRINAGLDVIHRKLDAVLARPA